MAEEPPSKKVKVIIVDEHGAQKVEYVDSTGLTTVGQVCDKADEQAGVPTGKRQIWGSVLGDEANRRVNQFVKNALEKMEEFEELIGFAPESGEEMKFYKLSFKKVQK